MEHIKLWIDEFSSLTSFVQYIETAQHNSAFKNAGCNDSENLGYSFNRTKDFAEAKSLLVKGYPEGLERILNAKTKIPFNANERQITRKIDFVGQRPHIVNAIVGKPKTMVRRIKEQPRVNTVTIVYDCGAGACVGADTLAKGGKNLMALVQHLEQHNVRVDLYMTLSASVRDRKDSTKLDAALLKVKIKDSKQALNPLMLSYPIAHPSFFRRHGFRWIETSKGTNDSRYTSGYGTQIRYRYGSTEQLVQDFRKYKVLKDNEYYLDCESCADADSIDYLFNKMQLKIK